MSCFSTLYRNNASLLYFSLSSKSVVIFANYCFTSVFEGFWCVSLHAYKSIILAVKTGQPLIIDLYIHFKTIKVSFCFISVYYIFLSKERFFPTILYPETVYTKKALVIFESFLAVRTRLELATPCVTGMYSNRLNYRTIYYVLEPFSLRFRLQRYTLFSFPPNIF